MLPQYCKGCQIHWQTPLLLLSSLLVGCCLAIGHHAFYQSLTGSSVDSYHFKLAGWTTSQQQLVSVAGVLFAFVVKASLILCASIAYMQLFFRAIQIHGLRMKTLDQWFAALGDIRSLFRVAAIYRYPLMTLIALTAWLLPLAAVFAPAALSVSFDLIQPSMVSLLRVPQPPFESIALSIFEVTPGADTPTAQEADIPINMAGPSEETARIANAVASGGTILPIQPPGSNASWQISLEAPRISCNDIQDEEIHRISENIITAFKGATGSPFGPTSFYQSRMSTMFSYLSWMSWTVYSNESRVNGDDNNTLPFVFNEYGNPDQWRIHDQADLTNAWIYGTNLSIGIFPNANVVPSGNWSALLEDDSSKVNPLWSNWTVGANLMMDWYLQGATLIKCELMNANYTLNFTYVNHQQIIEIVSVSDLPLPTQVYSNLEFDTTGNDTLAVKGWDLFDVPVGSTPDSMARKSQRSMSYTAIWQAMLTILLGASNKPYEMLGKAEFRNSTYRTGLFSTTLMDTLELSTLRKGILNATELTNRTSGPAFEKAASLLPLPGPQHQSRQPLKQALEDLFFNITISVMSSETLQYNASNPYAPAPVNVTFARYGNIYVYEPSKLWIPYGIAIGLSVLNAVCGFWAIFDTGASFTADFSTLARLVKNAEIDTEMREEVAPGKDPLPRRIGEAEFRLMGKDEVSR
ncbi:hypothetical protein AC578_5395 [Pseudocercospora eumusae]|uniref:Uncharacterized protein n=1 Tax=Pseudocercospora eumusae TaxID=321146 RepID=A0A139HJZ5_9PEZI|nr:hypothetical protein AC578_5395 [Pseudocercospora eumusae]